MQMFIKVVCGWFKYDHIIAYHLVMVECILTRDWRRKTKTCTLLWMLMH